LFNPSFIDIFPITPTDPVTPKLPVIWAEPVYGNGGVEGAYDALKAYDEVKGTKVDKFKLNVLPFPFVNVILGFENEAVVNNEPVSVVPPPPPPILTVNPLNASTVVVTPDPVKFVRSF